MSKKTFFIISIIALIVLIFAGCTKTDGTKTFITLMSVPTEATIPDGLHLDSILSITNADPNNSDPATATTTVQLGIFGFTNSQGEVEYYAYGKKESILDGETHLVDQGFYPVNFSRDGQSVSLSLKGSESTLTKVAPGTGDPTIYSGDLPLSFYTPSEQLGVYTFAEASGTTVYRVYATFGGTNGNFYPATVDGSMIPGSLPVNVTSEETLKNQGSSAASRLLTTPIKCTDIPIFFEV